MSVGLSTLDGRDEDVGVEACVGGVDTGDGMALVVGAAATVGAGVTAGLHPKKEDPIIPSDNRNSTDFKHLIMTEALLETIY